ncbi:ABC transporter transmembrane domain-containing protein [Brevibacillus choshinensis]|uniref:ATP-binding cassette domain-containing protein n=1 Tax=Brevibacillus choshinensis TaxID=54911 RepID=A0ABX7FPX1_BRECH|nr:ABC transporter transmembrane domain-containing protein [Brevibacillus choshinensis]QRG67745.1 ATP-binding cassette domain-containing protein [Brevibacillus choshinensis]
MLTVIKNLLSYMRSYKLLTSLFLLALLFDLAFISLAPLSFKFIIDKAVEPRDPDYFFFILKVLVFTGVICLGMGILSDFALARLHTRVQADLHKRIFEHIQHLPISYFQKTRSGDLVAFFSIDLPAIGRVMNVLLTTGIQSFFVVIVSTVVLFYLEWSMAALILVGAFAIFIGPYLLSPRARKASEDDLQQFTQMTTELQENMKAQKVIKGYNLQAAVIEKFSSRLQLLSATGYRRHLMNQQLERIPLISLLFINLTIIGLGSYLALTGKITVGALVAFFTMYTSMGNSVFGLTFVIPALTEARVSMERISDLLAQSREANGQRISFTSDTHSQVDVQVDHVTFGYETKQPVLKEVSLGIPPGSRAAFVGSSGSGKSTLLQLLLGFYDPQLGQVKINGTSLADWNRGAYRERIGVVFQENFLFHGSIYDNIRISQPLATREDVIWAAKKAEIHEYIIGLPDGYETMVLDEGSNFSGGQRQRIAIARAILRDPPILLLDEATSALDPISEASINRTFDELAKGRTVISVTHRLAAITGYDQIFVFDQGKLVDQGSHQEMLDRDGSYKGLWEKQSGLSLSQNGQEATIDQERLSRLPFFQGVDPAVLGEISDLFQTETYAKGQAIIQEGDAGEKFYLIARGKVEITKAAPDSDSGQIRLAVLEDGDHFGEIALLENVPRTATVTALTPCVFLTLQRKVLYYILSRYPEIDAHVKRTLAQRRS